MEDDLEEVENLLRRLAALAQKKRIATRSNTTLATKDKKL